MKVDNPMRQAKQAISRNVHDKKAPRKRNSRTIPLWPAMLSMILIAVLFYTLGAKFPISNLGSNGLDYSKLNQIYTALQQKYVGKLNTQDLIDGAAAGMVDSLDDQYTEYFTASEAKEFNSDLNGTLSGVGIQLGQNTKGQLEVVAPIDNSPAKAAGIEAGDVIAKINGSDSLTMSPDVAVNKIRGKAGTTVTLTISRNGVNKDYKLTRADITVPSTTWKVSLDNGKTWVANDDSNFAKTLASAGSNAIGYIRISTFGDDTASLSAKAAQAFASAGIKNIILDLRGNGGGYVDAAQSLVSLWLPQGSEITKEVGKNGSVLSNVTATGDPVFAKGTKTIVLIDSGSASASEITAAALHDNDYATLLGQKSYGKGCMQELVNLSGGAQLKVTVANWYTPDGKNITGKGITPDVPVSLSSAQANSGDDTQLNAAISQFAK